MPGLTTTLLGRQMKTYALLTDTKATKWRAPIGNVETDDDQFEAGEIVFLGSSGKIKRVDTGGTALGATADSIIGVAFDNFTPGLNECQGAGLGTMIIDPGHIGKTKQFISTDSYAIGEAVGGSNATKGKFSADNTAGLNVGYTVALRGSWLEYVWAGRVASS